MKIDFNQLDYSFKKKPLLVGGMAMEIPKYHKDLELIVKRTLDIAYGVYKPQ